MSELSRFESCALCAQEAPLQDSHIIPAFAFRWLKAGSAGPIRHTANMNKRVQDGATLELLCSECEERFNAWETAFANNIFNTFSYEGSLPSINYDGWLLHFCVSVSWRSLQYLRHQGGLQHFNADQMALVSEASQIWSDFLLGRREHPDRFEQHLIPFGPITEIGSIQFPPNINRYLLRAIEIDAGASPSVAFIFSKIGRLGVLGFIDLKKPNHWQGSRVRLRGGRINPRTYTFPTQFGEYLASRAQRVWNAQAATSPAQKKKIADSFAKNVDAFAKSQLRAAIELDLKLFGDAALNREATEL